MLSTTVAYKYSKQRIIHSWPSDNRNSCKHIPGILEKGTVKESKQTKNILVLWLSIQCFCIMLHKQQKDKKKWGYEVLYEIKEHGKVLQYRN